MKVEHWCSRALCPDNRELDYSNLFGVCKGRFSDGKFTHCDTSKGDTLIDLNIPPLKKARQSIIHNLRIALHKKYKNKRANYQKLLNKWQEKNEPYCMVAITYLESKISSS